MPDASQTDKILHENARTQQQAWFWKYTITSFNWWPLGLCTCKDGHFCSASSMGLGQSSICSWDFGVSYNFFRKQITLSIIFPPVWAKLFVWPVLWPFAWPKLWPLCLYQMGMDFSRFVQKRVHACCRLPYLGRWNFSQIGTDTWNT